MKRLLLATIAAIPFAGAAIAADMPVKAAPPPPAPVAYDWNGVYVGFHAGFGWSHTNSVNLNAPPVTSFPVGFGVTTEGKGPLLGGQIGWNWQVAPNFLFGVETQFSGTGSTSDEVSLSPTGNGATSHNSGTRNWMANVTGRAGYVANNWLLYAKGGWGWTHGDANGETFNAALVRTTVTSGGNSERLVGRRRHGVWICFQLVGVRRIQLPGTRARDGNSHHHVQLSCCQSSWICTPARS